jgi:hypothetical protein
LTALRKEVGHSLGFCQDREDILVLLTGTAKGT